MRNSQKGFMVPLLIAIIALLVIGGGVYVYNKEKVETPAVIDTETQQTNQVQQQTTNKTPSVAVTLDLSSSFARQFETVLSEAFKKPENFNGHYRVAEVGCGTGCFTFVLIDKDTGKIYPAPIGNDIGQFTGDIGQPYNLNSNQIKIIADNGSKINTYAFNGSSFSLLSSVASQSSVSTSNWKIYQNILGKYSVKYPTNWYIDTSTPSATIANYDWSVGGGNDAPISPENIVISITMYPNFSVSETVASWANRIGLSSKRDIFVDGIKAIRGRKIYTGQEESGYYQKGELSGDYVLVVYNGTGYQITYSPYGSKFANTFDQILSIFKFTK